MAERRKKHFVLFIGIYNFIIVSAEPRCGFKSRITTAGLNYANTVMLSKFTLRVQGKRLDDYHGSQGDVSYKISNFVVNSFPIPESKIAIRSNTRILWSVRNLGLSTHPDFSYEYIATLPFGIKAPPITDSGSIQIDIRGGTVDVIITMGLDNTGRPTINMADCKCHISSVNVEFYGGLAYIYDLFKSNVEDFIRDELQKAICSSVRNVNSDTSESFKELKVKSTIGRHYILDYSFLTKPTLVTDAVETYHKGVVYWRNETNQMSSLDALPMPTVDDNQMPPFDPPPMPIIHDNNKMLYLWISDFVVNSLSFQAQKHGILNYELTNNDFDGAKSGVLSTTCKFMRLCIGKIIPELNSKFPNSTVHIHMRSTTAPNIKLVHGEIVFSMEGEMTLFLKRPSATESQYLLTLNTFLTSSLNVSYANSHVYAEVKNIHFNGCISNTTVQPPTKESLSFLMQIVVQRFVQPSLNDLGADGFPVLKSDDVELVNTELQLIQDTLVIATDVKSI